MSQNLLTKAYNIDKKLKLSHYTPRKRLGGEGV
jgi:hypothetical protein